MHYWVIFIHQKMTLKKCLIDIEEVAKEATLIGTGDLYECTISKKDITDVKFTETRSGYANSRMALLNF